jgi:hypothetical protein
MFSYVIVTHIIDRDKETSRNREVSCKAQPVEQLPGAKARNGSRGDHFSQRRWSFRAKMPPLSVSPFHAWITR